MILAHLTSMCEHFDILDEIYSGKVKANPPCLYESASSSSAGIDITFGTDTIDVDVDEMIEYDPDYDLEQNVTENSMYSALQTSSTIAGNLARTSNPGGRSVNLVDLASLNVFFHPTINLMYLIP